MMLLPNFSPNLWQRSVQKLAALSFISKILAHSLHRLDPFLLRASNGQHTATTWLTGLPVFWLTTIGRKSGNAHTTPLLGIPGAEGIALVASNFGNPHHPHWYLNLKKNPRALLKLNEVSVACLAQEIIGAEYEKLWETATLMYAGYSAYKVRANGRHIPIMLLRTAGEANSIDPED